ncbi:hypothetical protein DV515_00015669 [Chloebia gouldiae]|uniref:Uncharacterized protein n=1 Tax=Chloebia gouldiae TaxID=44316 RepID=A0A3L8RW32_CHLGU|nr:hypothetical protein DV515_00015669 [Chloebia gouldiae]
MGKHNCCSISLKTDISSAQTKERTPRPLTNKQTAHRTRKGSGKCCCSLLAKHFPFLHCVLSSCDIQWPNTIRLGLGQTSSYMSPSMALFIFKKLYKHEFINPAQLTGHSNAAIPKVHTGGDSTLQRHGNQLLRHVENLLQDQSAGPSAPRQGAER